MTFQKIPRGVDDDAQKSVASFFGVAYEVIDYIKSIGTIRTAVDGRIVLS
jgi:hypothetical protein